MQAVYATPPDVASITRTASGSIKFEPELELEAPADDAIRTFSRDAGEAIFEAAAIVVYTCPSLRITRAHWFAAGTTFADFFRATAEFYSTQAGLDAPKVAQLVASEDSNDWSEIGEPPPVTYGDYLFFLGNMVGLVKTAPHTYELNLGPI